MILKDLMDRAEKSPNEDDFYLTVSDVNLILGLKDRDVSELLLWLKQKKVSLQKLDDDLTKGTLWLKIHTEDTNFRTKFYCLVSYLMLKNPLLKDSLQKVLRLL